MSSDPSKTSGSKEDDNYLNSKKDFTPTKFEDFGYFFFPERFGNIYKPSWFEKYMRFPTTTEQINRIRCEISVQKAIQTRKVFNLLKHLNLEIGHKQELIM